MEVVKTLVDRKVTTYKEQQGDVEHPARSCRDIQLDHPEYRSGEYSLYTGASVLRRGATTKTKLLSTIYKRTTESTGSLVNAFQSVRTATKNIL